ncbi:MAG: ABC transporter permease [Candidatus Andersenbacteria bacterium]|nr:ABC transporter permease [Candidatus Andersenbacteria bacterium]
MDNKETLMTAFEALLGNKLRTGLAILGIVIGIGAVVALITLGQGATQSVQNSISTLGANLLTVSPGAASQGGGIRGSAGSGTSLTLADAQAITSSPTVTTVKAVSAEASRNYQVTYKKENTNSSVTGAFATYLSVHDDTLAQGTFFTEKDMNSLAKKAVLGATVATDLFGTANPIGQTVQINHIPFKVVGVLTSKGGTGFFSQDDIILAPLLTVQKLLLGSSNIQSISVQATSSDVMTTASEQITTLLLNRHHIKDPAKADFNIRSQADILSTATSATSTLTGLLAGIAAISLLVGGIGIMNIMLVTITERTREIGIRKAIGAKKKDILTQFLFESIVLTLTGGILGILFGFALSFLGSKLLSIPFTITFFAPFIAFTVSSAIGIIFGYYPARKAATMQPIQALRYE